MHRESKMDVFQFSPGTMSYFTIPHILNSSNIKKYFLLYIRVASNKSEVRNIGAWFMNVTRVQVVLIVQCGI